MHISGVHIVGWIRDPERIQRIIKTGGIAMSRRYTKTKGAGMLVGLTRYGDQFRKQSTRPAQTQNRMMRRAQRKGK